MSDSPYPPNFNVHGHTQGDCESWSGSNYYYYCYYYHHYYYYYYYYYYYFSSKLRDHAKQQTVVGIGLSKYEL